MLEGSSEMSLGLGMETCCLVSFIMGSAKRVLQRMGGLFGLTGSCEVCEEQVEMFVESQCLSQKHILVSPSPLH